MSARITIEAPEDLRFLPKEALGSWTDQGFIERQRAKDVWQYVQDTVKDPNRVGAYLAGPMGVGKSSIMYYVVHKARQRGWFVVYIPRCDSWLIMGYPLLIGWYSYFFDAVLAGLQFVTANIKEKYAYCLPPNSHSSWSRATCYEDFSLEFFEELFKVFREDILRENNVEVILAFDDVHALFENGLRPLITAPFSLIDWAASLKRGCVFVTATADFPYRRTLRAGHERYVLNVGPLSDEEVEAWFQTKQFANIAQHPDFSEEFIPEIRSQTGDIPRELVILSEAFGHRQKSLREIIEAYSGSRRSIYNARLDLVAKKYPHNVNRYMRAMMKFFIRVYVRENEVPLEFLDTGVVFIDRGFAVPLNTNAVKCFHKQLLKPNEETWNNEILHELENLTSYNMSRAESAFERLFVLNLLSPKNSWKSYPENLITLNYYNLAGVKEQRFIQIRHFLTLSAENRKKSWKDYPADTLVAHSKSGERRMDFIYFGREDCIIFFEVTIAEDVFKDKYPSLNTDRRLDMILSSMSKWMGCSMRLNDKRNAFQPARKSYNGVVEYMVVSSRRLVEEKLELGAQKMEQFPWLKIMDRDGLARIFPKSHVESLGEAMSKTNQNQ